jgi:hypothetical protein
MNKNNVVAIDFGTSRTKLAFFNPRTRNVEVMRHPPGLDPYVPSYFAVDKNQEILVGYAAQNMFESKDWKDTRRTVSNIKGQISEDVLIIDFRSIKKSPQELLTALFIHLKKEAGKLSAFETEPQKAYLTYPTTFSVKDQNILENSAQAAGFSVELIEEPVAAAQFVARSRDIGLKDITDIILLDCGAGTLHWTYMQRQYIYRDKPMYIIRDESGELKPGGTISGITEKSIGGGTTKRIIGGRSIEVALAYTLQSQVGRITKDDFEFLCHEIRLRKEEFCQNPGDEPRPIEISDFTVQVSARNIKAAIQEHYVVPACNEIEPYIQKVIGVTGRKPALILTGGCSHIKEFQVALRERFELKCITIPGFEYATVRGALPVPEDTQTQQTESIEPEHQEVVTTIKETFERFGQEMGDIIAADVMSRLRALVDDRSSKWKSLDIVGTQPDLIKYVTDTGWNHFLIKANIISYFVENLPASIFSKTSEIIDFFRRLDGEVLSKAMPSPTQVQHTYEEDVKQVVGSVILAKLDIEEEIKDVVFNCRFGRWFFGVPTMGVSEVVLFASRKIKGTTRVESRQDWVKDNIRRKLEDRLKNSFKNQDACLKYKAHIRDAVAEVFRTTAEKSCRSVYGRTPTL